MMSMHCILHKDLAVGSVCNKSMVIKMSDKNNLGKDKPIIPGMTASVDILTGQKTVLDYLMKPILKVRQNALTEQ